MTRQRLGRLRRQLAALRQRGGVPSRELESLARSIGRTRHPRGKEPTWVHTKYPDLRPLSIPNHPGDLNRITARTILDQLEADLDRIEVELED